METSIDEQTDETFKFSDRRLYEIEMEKLIRSGRAAKPEKQEKIDRQYEVLAEEYVRFLQR
jgi:hypothetical protein